MPNQLFFQTCKNINNPAGKSLVAITSENESAGIGADSDAIIIHELPETITGHTLETSPSRDGSSGRRIPTTPVGSGIEKLNIRPEQD